MGNLRLSDHVVQNLNWKANDALGHWTKRIQIWWLSLTWPSASFAHKLQDFALRDRSGQNGPLVNYRLSFFNSKNHNLNKKMLRTSFCVALLVTLTQSINKYKTATSREVTEIQLQPSSWSFSLVFTTHSVVIEINKVTMLRKDVKNFLLPYWLP